METKTMHIKASRETVESLINNSSKTIENLYAKVKADNGMPNPLEHSLVILSEALRMAESTGDKELVAEVYMEMGKFMASEYTALGLSLIRKVETYCKRSGLKQGGIGAKVYRARCSYMMWTHDKYNWVKDRERFAKEAVRLLETINPEEIQSQYNKDMYWGLRREIEAYQKKTKGNGN